jgi:hypothetical protein
MGKCSLGKGAYRHPTSFFVFVLLGPAFAAAMQFLLLNAVFLVFYFRDGLGVTAALLFISMELSGGW